MKTSEFLNKLKTSDQTLAFQLPSGDFILGDLHITEVKNIHVDSTDCGGNTHSFQETVIQLWLNEKSRKRVSWTTTKASNIFEKVGHQRAYLLDSEAFIEFGDSANITSKYAIEIVDGDEHLIVKLNYVYPQCKPRLLQPFACC